MSGLRAVVDFLVIASLGLAALQVYLTTNRLWKRKHERAVAESISILGEFVGFVPVAFLTLKFSLDGQWAGVADGLIWAVGAGVAVLIATGRWVEGRRERGLLGLLREAIQVERGEVGYLARSFIRPSGANRILRILGRVALLDDELDARERAFVESFARGWGIHFDWAAIPAQAGDDPLDFLPLRLDVQEYLATSPPPAQVRQLGDVLRALVGIDQTVTRQESVMLAEVEGMIGAYLNEEDEERALFAVVLVPQGPEQDRAIASVLPGLDRRELHGGQVYVAGSYHSFDFAEIVSAQYRALNFFTAVLRISDAATLPQTA
jgi:hypothetical protein